jgi:poly(3-hydroxyalkanoate) synthetase
MNREFHNARRLSRRLNLEQSADYLGYSVEQASVLVRCGHLKCLGNPPSANCSKYCLLDDLEQLDSAWFAKAQNILYRTTRNRNQRKPELDHSASAHAKAKHAA